MSIFVLSRQWAGTVNRPKAPSVTKCVRRPKGLDAGREPCYSLGMKNETTLPATVTPETVRAVAALLPPAWERVYVGGGRFEEYETVNPAVTALLALANELEA